MVAPIGLFLQMPLLRENLDRGLALHDTDYLRHGIFWGNGTDRMDMVGPNRKFFYQNIVPFTNLFNSGLDYFLDLSFQNPKPILRSPNYVIRATIDTMR